MMLSQFLCYMFLLSRLLFVSLGFSPENSGLSHDHDTKQQEAFKKSQIRASLLF